MTRFSLAATIALTLAAAPAAQAGYTLKPVKVHGKPAGSVDVISAAGTLGGTYHNAAGTQLGFLLSAGTLTTLKPASQYLYDPRPTGINEKGVVAGFLQGAYQVSYGFTWKNGHYKQTWQADEDGPGLGLNGVSINRSGTVAFNSYQGQAQYLAYYGKPNSFQQIQLTGGQGDFVENINRAGTTAGNYETYPLPAIFTCTSAGVVTTIPGPGGTAASGGFINDSGAVAGTGGPGGFVFKNGKYKTFVIPAAVGMNVTGFSNTGIVVGTYTDASGAYHGFAWNGKTVFELVPNPSANHIVTVVGVSDAGDVALNLNDRTTGTNVPYVALCQGNGC